MTAALAPLLPVLPVLEEGNEEEECSCHLPFVGVPKGCRGECLEAGQLGIQEETILVLLQPLGHVSLCRSVPQTQALFFCFICLTEVCNRDTPLYSMS